MTELLAPAGDSEKAAAALYFGADAIYLAGKNFGLRAGTGNFTLDEMERTVSAAHALGRKVYVAVNVFARESDFCALPEYLSALNRIRPDGLIVSDLGVAAQAKKLSPGVPLHLSTQANLTNKYAAREYAEFGFSRLVLSRELSLGEIRAIRDFLPDSVELEAFVHGAMCISYSGRCLLSSFLTGRSGNRGECAQSCRWEYSLKERSRGDELPIEEDERGAYILNSKDMNMLAHLDKLADAGVASFKIEGRNKSSYYVATVVNAYRRAIDLLPARPYSPPRALAADLDKVSHRMYFTGFYLGEESEGQCYDTSKPASTYDFIAVVRETSSGGAAVVEMRNRFRRGDALEILSPSDSFGKTFTVERMETESGEEITDARNVMQRIRLYCPFTLNAGDYLRRAAVG